MSNDFAAVGLFFVDESGVCKRVRVEQTLEENICRVEVRWVIPHRRASIHGTRI
jgi:hypothetical protein